MARPQDVQEMLRSQLIAARQQGHSERKLNLDGREVRVTVNSTSLRIMVCTTPLYGFEPQDINILDAVRRLLGNPPDAVYTRSQGENQTVNYCAVWGNPELSFHEELAPLVPEIYAAGNQVLLISQRLRSYLVPDHPRKWMPYQVDLWQRFWTLRLENPHERERIEFFSHPRTWDYFQVLAKKLASLTAEEIPDKTQARTLQPKIEEVYCTAALTGYHIFLLGHPEPLDFRALDFSRVSELVPGNMGWDSIPEPVLQVINEINVSDIRTSGNLFKRAVLMSPEILDGLLLNANKCAVLGYTTGAMARRLKTQDMPPGAEHVL